MENPNTWQSVELVIARAIREYIKDSSDGIYGLSMIRVIADALRKEGLIKES